MTTTARRLTALGLALAVLVLRVVQIRGAWPIVYHGEFAGIARLGWELDQGAFAWTGLSDFVHAHTYQHFAQGTLFLQLVAAALVPLVGPTLWAQHGAAALLEAATVGLFALLALREGGWRGLAAIAFVLVPGSVAFFQLQPYGNHTEYLWVPAALGLALSSRRAGMWGAGLLLVGVLCYRGNALAVAAFVAVLLRERRWVQAALVPIGALLLSGVFLWLGLGPLGTGENRGALPGMGLEPDRLSELQHLGAVGPWPVAHQALLLGAVVVALVSWVRPMSPALRFASLWGLLAVLVPWLTGNLLGRYLMPAFYAGTLVLVLACRWRPMWALLVPVVAMGAVENARLIGPEQPMLPLSVWFELEVNHVDIDELEHWAALRDGSRWVGWSTHFPASACRPLRGSRPGEDPRLGEGTCGAWREGELCRVAEAALGAGASRQDLVDVGRGAFIRGDRQSLVAGLRGCDFPEVLDGAR